MKEVLTASRMSTLLTCPRKHYYRYELKLQSTHDSEALSFGTAWHNAMEARWSGKPYDEALALAVGSANVTEQMASTLAGLLAGYYSYYSERNEIVSSLMPELQFRYPLAGSKKFDCAGKIDGLGETKDGLQVLLEHKTSGEDIAPDSDYWSRLRFNSQIYQYSHASRQHGWDIQKVIYDVTRKPTIRPLESMPVLDDCGLKQVVDLFGNRVFKKDGQPKQTADKEKGESVLSAPETCEQFSKRLYLDTVARPEFYFARREVSILDQDVEQFIEQRLAIAKMILYYRKSAKSMKTPEWAWLRNCNGLTCRSCEFSSFCLQNLSVDVANPPMGFKQGEQNPELGIA